MLQLRLSVIFSFLPQNQIFIPVVLTPQFFLSCMNFPLNVYFFVHEYCHMMSCELFLIGLP